MSGVKIEEERQISLTRLAECVKKHLGVPDDDLTVSRFVLSLYDQPQVNHDKQAFVDVLKANGGDSFPPEFINSCYDILKQEVKTEPAIKQEFAGLSIPNTTTIKRDPEVKVEPSVKTERIEGKIKLESEELQVGQVYRGYVSNLTSYGAFMKLNDPRSFQSGLCHVSKISFDGRTRVQSPSDVLKYNQEVFVKIIAIEPQQGRKQREKITLSMRGIDQATGLDKTEEIKQQQEEDRKSRSTMRDNYKESLNRGVKRRLTSPERWEIRQLIASGAAKEEDYPELDAYDDPNAAFVDENSSSKEGEVDIEIELNHKEPTFLKGQTNNSIDLAPVKVFKNPEGSLNRSAMNGSKLAREFKDEKVKERTEQDKAKRKESRGISSHDPLNKTKEDEATQEVITGWKKAQMATNIEYGKKTTVPIAEQRKSLPVYAMRSELVQAVKDNQFLVVVGETGSGKTTQIVQYLMEEGFNNTADGTKIIGCTQPRRVAAISVAKRVSEEVGCRVGTTVGYNVRFDDQTSAQTKIKYMTDGMLQREALNDPYMTRYSVIMLDEAHERTISTDVLFALLKQAASKNPDLKIISTSATLDSVKFSRYFNNCPVINIPGRTYPVEILYTKEPEMDYLAAALDSVVQIHISEPEGDILVFLTGQEEIDTSCDVLYERMKKLGNAVPELIILPVYSALPSEMQSRIFEPAPPGSRKVILATNIAETSITIDGIYYVVDPGFVKINAYDSKLGMDSLMVSPISQAQANQRSGRAGRTGPGKCYRLYPETAYRNEMLPNTIPEIQRQNLSHTILMLKAMGINDLLSFEFMDPPPTTTMLTALQELYTLSALDEEGYLTQLGKKMADLPMQPTLAKTLLASVEFGCTDEILSIIAMVTVQTVFYRPKDKQTLADQRKARFHHPHGDHLTFLNVYRAWVLNNYSKGWCLENFIQERSMRRAQEVRRQLTSIMRRYDSAIESCGASLDKVRRALVAGFFKNSSKRDPQEGGYKTVVDQTPVFLHPSSSVFGKNPEYLLYHTLLLTTREYMHCVSVIDPRWLVELAPNFFKQADGTNLSESKKRQKIVPLFNKFAKNQDEWRLSSHNQKKIRALEKANDER